jgi:hypothetical protein
MERIAARLMESIHMKSMLPIGKKIKTVNCNCIDKENRTFNTLFFSLYF